MYWVFKNFSKPQVSYILFISNLMKHSDHGFNLFESFLELWDHTSSP